MSAVVTAARSRAPQPPVLDASMVNIKTHLALSALDLWLFSIARPLGRTILQVNGSAKRIILLLAAIAPGKAASVCQGILPCNENRMQARYRATERPSL